MNIWILNPPFPIDMIKEGRCEQETSLFQTNYPPLTMAYLASILRSRYNVQLIDAVTKQISMDYLIQKFKKKLPKIVFVNTSTPTFNADIANIKKLSLLSKNTKFYLYGVHASYFKDTQKYTSNIELIKGEPEKKAFELLQQKSVKFNDFPMPAWDLVDLSDYKITLKNKPFLIIQTSRGCPHTCNFCTAPFYYGSKYKKREVKKIIEEIKYIISLGVEDILFYSETFTLDNKYVTEICEQIIEHNLKINWMCNSRVDTVNKELLTLMKKAGCWLISYGIESSSQKILDSSQKKYKTSSALDAIEMTNSANILSIGHFILGLPGETVKSIKETITLSINLGLTFALYYIATPFPGSKLYENLKQEYSWEKVKYNVNSINPNLNLENQLSIAYREFYFNPKQIKTIFKLIKVLGINNIFNILKSGLKSIKSISK